MTTENAAVVPLLARLSVKIPEDKPGGPDDGPPPGTLYTMTARETTDDD